MGYETYGAGDDESAEEIPQEVEEHRDDLRELHVGRDRNRHDPVVGEEEEREEHEEEEPEELGGRPLELHQGVGHQAVQDVLGDAAGEEEGRKVGRGMPPGRGGRKIGRGMRLGIERC